MAHQNGQAVTLLITRTVKPGCEVQYEDWLGRLQTEARSLRGYLGVTTQRPVPGGPREYTSVVHFDSLESLKHFEGSNLRARYLGEVRAWVEADAVWQQLTGMEFWFTPPPGTVVPQPSRPRMAALMIAVVFLLVLSIGSLVGMVTDRLPYAAPYPLKLLLTITLEVLVMTYWLMPQLTRRLAKWIYPGPVTTVR